MAADRWLPTDALRLWTDQIDSSIAFLQARNRLRRQEKSEPRNLTTTILVGGEFASTELFTTAELFENAGFPSIDIADIPSTGSIRERAQRLEEHILRYDGQINLVCYSMGCAIAMATLMNPKVAERVKVAVLVGGPTHSGTHKDFNQLAVMYPTNDFLSDPTLPALIDQSAPKKTKIISIELEGDPMMNGSLSERPDIIVRRARRPGHHRMYVDDEIFEMTVSALCEDENAA